MKIELGKWYQTRDGRAVRIYAVDGDEKFPVHGAYRNDRGLWVVDTWSADGVYNPEYPRSDYDLIELPPVPPDGDGWVNEYHKLGFFGVHESRERADDTAGSGRIALIHLSRRNGVVTMDRILVDGEKRENSQ